ncbi:hypothetical protein [Roseovarius sp. M141]|uniref:hypothetical protein n=1 Tax=Roseovarius sp. M141 TaxID=2583806 RepID=UPI0020CDD5A9|nr:hypothetical protein [Roseovarius sp. M141]MCQ0093384.1 hypothetical protein [Roseovarius sp. M141]
MWHILFSAENRRRLNTAMICRPSGHHQLSRVTLASQPMGVFDDPMPSSDEYDAVTKAYIRCTKDGIIPHGEQKAMIQDIYATSGQLVYENALETLHFPQLTMPEKLASMIVDAIMA